MVTAKGFHVRTVFNDQPGALAKLILDLEAVDIGKTNLGGWQARIQGVKRLHRRVNGCHSGCEEKNILRGALVQCGQSIAQPHPRFSMFRGWRAVVQQGLRMAAGYDLPGMLPERQQGFMALFRGSDRTNAAVFQHLGRLP